MSDRTESRTRINPERHPALFQRVTPTNPTPSRPAEEINGKPTAAGITIYADLITHLQFHPADLRHADESYRTRSTLAAAVRFLESRGLSHDEILSLNFGLYPTADEVRSYLRRIGYGDTAIEESGLVSDADGHRHGDWEGCLIAPVCDANGEVVDVVAFVPTPSPSQRAHYRFARGPKFSGVPACGLRSPFASAALSTELVLVEDVADAFYLQARGIENVVAIAGDGPEFTATRWQQLAKLGVRSVVLAFRKDSTCYRDVRSCLDHALHARSTPEVFVFDHDRIGDDDTLADFARKHGVSACRKTLEYRSRAFHGKAFGWTDRVTEPARRNGTKPVSLPEPKPERYTSLRAWLQAEAERLTDLDDRRAMHDLIADVDDALRRGHFQLARDLVESRLGSFQAPAPKAECVSVGDVVGRLIRNDDRHRVDEELLSCDGTDRHAGTVTVLAQATRRGRFTELCGRIVHALENWTGTSVVVCREFTEEEITLGVIAHMTRRLSDGEGLSVEEIHTRLIGHDPRNGYGDKPWLVDESVDRLRQWAERIQFVDGNIERQTVEVLKSLFNDRQLGAVFVDHLGEFSNWSSYERNWHYEEPMLRDLESLADRFRCPVIAISTEPMQIATPPAKSNAHWVRVERSATPWNRDFYLGLHDWIDRESGDEYRYRFKNV